MKWFFLLICSLPYFAKTQNLTGTWVGSSGMAYVKLVVIHKADSVFGYTYDEGPGFCKATFLGKYANPMRRLKGHGNQMLKNSGGHGLCEYDLQYSTYDSVEYLRGFVTSKSLFVKLLSGNYKEAISLKKFSSKIDTIAYMHSLLGKPATTPSVVVKISDSIVGKPSVSVITVAPGTEEPITQQKHQRISRLVETIKTAEDTIRVFVYDNGEIDDDSVTIFFDNKVILDKYKITSSGKELIIAVPRDGKTHSIELFANNLGMIPPNTALVVILAGARRFELRTSYDLQTNALISIQYDPE